jgi:hypothetical protein
MKILIPISLSQARLLRLRAQLLIEPGAIPVAQLLKTVVGVQAQEMAAARLQIRARSSGLTTADVERARLQERSVVWTWAMRGTLFLLSAEDYAWLQPIFGALMVNGDRSRMRQLGLDEATAAQGVRLLCELLASQGPLTRNELAERLSPQGVPMGGQASIHLIAHATAQGLIIRGPDKDGEPAYLLPGDWLKPGSPLPREDAIAELARRYLAAYAPASAADFAAWSGLSLKEARAGFSAIASELVEVEIDGTAALMLKSQLPWLDELSTGSPVVRLLPRFDNYLLGYASRDLALAPQYAKRINAGGGIIHPALCVDGRILGKWSTQKARSLLKVVLEPFETLPADLLPAIEAEVTDLGRFLGLDSHLTGLRDL